MFTGIVTDALIEQIVPDSSGWVLMINAPSIAQKVKIGDSVAIDGACLSVIRINGNLLAFYVSSESIDKTIIQFYTVKTKKTVDWMSLKMLRAVF